MKSIEQFVFDKYIYQQSQPKKYFIEASNYIDWAQIAVREAQRWIPLDEELPDADNYDCCLWKNEKEIWYGMARESQKPTHWRPLERRL